MAKFEHNPLPQIIYTQKFGGWPEYYKKYNLKGHNGIDLKTKSKEFPRGEIPVYAVADGVVAEAKKGKTGYGNFIRLKHNDGSETVYAHLSKIIVKNKQKIKAGETIGISGNTGDSTGPHLHFGYRPPRCDYRNGYNGYADAANMLK